ncbi:MAG: 16S rRNA (cytidine(1402)-2'-O)-methyltransferase [Desulfobulbaceae bacterium]|nr:16S rRNA (cytidine(1402)-2'-O)-methyltransferase [Desulfobulbaceae bacterium]
MVRGRRKKDGRASVPDDQKTTTLYIVATPIGNLEDITLRAIRILKEVDLIASEDTRHTRKLLSHFDIHTPLISYHKDREAAQAGKLLDRLLAGEDIAMVSDAGTPAISDPGTILARKAREFGIKVAPVPGPSALTAALSISGFDTARFLFLGFLPSRRNQCVKLLKTLSGSPETLVFFESPHRIVRCLKDCIEILGDRNIFLARELTKIHEETITGPLSSVLGDLLNRDFIKGEFTAIIEGEERRGPAGDDINELLLWYRDKSGLSMKDAVQRIARDLGESRSHVYKMALNIWSPKMKEG